MNIVLRQIFACCLRSPSTSKDESTPPSSSITPDVPGPTEADRQRVKERLGTIVRSKRGKMVNVADHLPFNLTNRSIPNASTSRLRAESPSPHPSVGTGETSSTSRSRSSRRPLIGRLGPSKEPALNARLVKGRDRSYRGSTARGRSGRFGEERDTGLCETEDPSNAANLAKMHIIDLDTISPDIEPLADGDRDHILALSEEIARQLRDGWEIGDSGPISRGWG